MVAVDVQNRVLAKDGGSHDRLFLVKEVTGYDNLTTIQKVAPHYFTFN